MYIYSRCSERTQKYNCPRCNIAYCSVACYKSSTHLKCSEEFYKSCVLEEMTLQSKLKNTPGPSDDVKRMYEILKRIQDDQPIDSDSENSDEELDSDDDDNDDENSVNEGDLSKRLAGIDLNDADAVWSHLTETERQEFNKMIQGEDVTSILPKFNAWWENKIKRKLVSETNESEPKVEHPHIIESIVEFDRISKKPPALCVGNNLTNLLAGYASMARFFYGEHQSNKNGAINYLVAVCANLRSNANFDDSDLAIESIRHDALTQGYSIDEHDVRQMRKDVDNLIEGPKSDKPTNTFILAALSDLHRLLLAVKTAKKFEQLQIAAATNSVKIQNSSSVEPITDSEQFSILFSDHKKNDCLNVEKGKLNVIIKKVEYYLAYAKKYRD